MTLGPLRFTNALGGTADWIYPGPTIDLQSPASAGAVNGTTYLIYAEALDRSQWEIATGAYTSSTGTFARTTVLFNSLGTTAKINFAEPPAVSVYDDTSYANLASSNTFTDTTESTSHSTGSQILNGGLGVAKTIFTGESLGNDGDISSFPTLDTSSKSYSIASGATYDISAGNSSGILFINHPVSGSTAIFIVGGGIVALVGQAGSEFAATSTPSVSQLGVYYDSTTPCYRVKNGVATTQTFQAQFFKLRPSV